MALTPSEEERLQRIENALADHAKAINNLAAKRQLSHFSTLITRELQELRDQLASLQSQLDAIKQ